MPTSIFALRRQSDAHANRAVEQCRAQRGSRYFRPKRARPRRRGGRRGCVCLAALNLSPLKHALESPRVAPANFYLRFVPRTLSRLAAVSCAIPRAAQEAEARWPASPYPGSQPSRSPHPALPPPSVPAGPLHPAQPGSQPASRPPLARALIAFLFPPVRPHILPRTQTQELHTPHSAEPARGRHGHRISRRQTHRALTQWHRFRLP